MFEQQKAQYLQQLLFVQQQIQLHQLHQVCVHSMQLYNVFINQYWRHTSEKSGFLAILMVSVNLVCILLYTIGEFNMDGNTIQ